MINLISTMPTPQSTEAYRDAGDSARCPSAHSQSLKIDAMESRSHRRCKNCSIVFSFASKDHWGRFTSVSEPSSCCGDTVHVHPSEDYRRVLVCWECGSWGHVLGESSCRECKRSHDGADIRAWVRWSAPWNFWLVDMEELEKARIWKNRKTRKEDDEGLGGLC